MYELLLIFLFQRANYQAYAAAYGTSYDQYQAAAAYNAAAYRAMQTNQTAGAQPPGAVPKTIGGVSISQPAQRYDYAISAAYASNMMGKPAGTAAPTPKWNPTVPGAAQSKKLGSQFKRRPPSGPVQFFYCEVCKISCAGPQVNQKWQTFDSSQIKYLNFLFC